MKILVAIDTSPSTSTIIQQITSRPWPEGSTFCAFTVVDTKALDTQFVGAESLSRFQIETATALVNSAAHKLSDRGLKATTGYSEGYPQSEIIEYAKQGDFDLLIVGSHGTSALIRFFLGSTSKAVLREAPCSVEIIRNPLIEEAPTDNAGMKILIATDGSDFSMAALQSVAERPWPPGSEIQVVSVFDPAVPLADPAYISVDIIQKILDENQDHARRALEWGENFLKETGLPVTGKILKGEPKSQLLDEAKQWGATLMVVGSHGRRGITRFLLGSVSEAVALHAPCTVEVIRKK